MPNQQPGWVDPQEQQGVFNNAALAPPGLGYGQPLVGYGQPLAGFTQPLAGYGQTGPAYAPLPQLTNQLTYQLSTQERSQQEAFNREMQAFNEVRRNKTYNNTNKYFSIILCFLKHFF